MTLVVISIGSNIGDSPAIVERAIASVSSFLKLPKVSTVIETKPWGFEDQPNFLNAVMMGEYEGTPFELLKRLQELEMAEKRVRDIHWGPRTLDLDIILFGEEIIDTDLLQIPHPHAHERAFVLEPWLEIDPEANIPHRGRVKDLLDLLA